MRQPARHPSKPARRAGAALACGAALAGAIALLAGARPARAGDGAYGRLDGDLELRVHAGAAFASGGPALAASVSALYLSTAGVYVHYTDALGSGAPSVTRSLSGGVHFSPLFLARYAYDLERGPAFTDLVLDSLALEMGAFWTATRAAATPAEPAPAGSATWDEHPGFELALGAGLPLFARSSGAWIGLRGALRWRPGDFVAGAQGNAVDRGAVLSLTLGWHQVLRAHLVDPGDRVRP